MFRGAFRPFASSLCSARGLGVSITFTSTRHFHRVTTDFISQDAGGKLVVRKLPGIIGNPGQTYVLIDPEVGSALRTATAASPPVGAANSASSASAADVGDTCALTFFHDSQYFGFESPSYPRLYIPNQIPRQTESNISPATLFLSGKMHEIVLDGTPDAIFAESASATGKNLGGVLDQLKDM